MRDLHKTTDMSFYLLVCLLSYLGITSADETGFVTVAEGDDALLPCSLRSKENIEQMTFDWWKDDEDRKEVFYYVKGSHYNNGRSGQDPQFKGRVTHFQNELKVGNASIKIRNTELSDNGSYTCIFPEKQRSQITLYVGAAPKPDVKPVVSRAEYATLQCKAHGVPEPTVEWKDSTGGVLPAKREVENPDGRFDITLQVNVTTSDNFTCVVTQEEIYHRINDTIPIYVHGGASKPSVKILNVTKEGTLLLCVVQCVSPKAEVIWQDSAGNIYPSLKPQKTEKDGSCNILLFTTVTKTDHYRCTVTQKELNHQASAETFVQISELPTGLIIAVVVLSIVLLLVVTPHIVGIAKDCIMKLKSKPGQNSNVESAHLNSNSPSGQITYQNP